MSQDVSSDRTWPRIHDHLFVSSDRSLRSGASGRVLAGEEFAVVAAEEEGGTVQVAAERLKAVGGVAYVGQK